MDYRHRLDEVTRRVIAARSTADLLDDIEAALVVQVQAVRSVDDELAAEAMMERTTMLEVLRARHPGRYKDWLTGPSHGRPEALRDHFPEAA